MGCSSLLPKGVGERRFALSLFFASLFPLPPETPENSGYFFPNGALLFFLRGWGRGDSPSLSFSLLSSPLPQKRLRTQAIFFTMGLFSSSYGGGGEEIRPLPLFRFSLPPSPRNAWELRLFFSQWGSSLLPKGVGEMRFPLSLYRFSLPPSPRNVWIDRPSMPSSDVTHYPKTG